MSASNVPYDTNEFTGKRILVTGGSKGIGKAIVNRLLRGGATVLATARTIPAGANAEKFIQADVSTRAGADHIIKTTFERFGGGIGKINTLFRRQEEYCWVSRVVKHASPRSRIGESGVSTTCPARLSVRRSILRSLRRYVPVSG
jgi:NAD(P)-dependent dehydrogenase (short-subunit alcohol dehydrogenase family)